MKLLLVIDVADDVAEAYEDFTVDYDLRGTPKDDPITSESIRYVEDCPLKPMPEKMRTDADDIEEDSYCQGWNECLEEIEK